jgi:dTDP-4-dehydrorhamnose 3,5-epimerase
MGPVNLSEIKITPLKTIEVKGGDVKQALRIGESGYSGFGEAYFSMVEYNRIKAWKRHTKMTMNLVVPVGVVRFVFYSDYDKVFREIDIGELNYSRITVPPGLWFGFVGMAVGLNVVLNISDILHDPYEAERRTVGEFEYVWDQPLIM